MLNRRFLRIKVLQELYAYQQSNESNLSVAEHRLLSDINKLYELFVWQLSFWVEVKRFAEMRIEENKHKHFPTQEDLNPNLRFVNNRILCILDNNTHLLTLEEEYKINWADHRDDFIRGFYNKLREFPEYAVYMSSENDSWENDKNFLLTIIDNYMADNSSLFDFYADNSLFFNSDYQLAIFLLWKFINELTTKFDINSKLPPVYKSIDANDPESDKQFALKLFIKTILHQKEYEVTIGENTSNWERERIAIMDMLILKMALTEFYEFHSIPIKVTINEYIEISKYYSTPDSKRFINGLLDKMATKLKEDGSIVKTGRGLIDNR
jgi:transcription antitermination factor NusB